MTSGDVLQESNERRQGPVPVMRVYGTTDKGNSACIFVHGFTPYGLFAAPNDFEETESNLKLMEKMLDDRLSCTVRNARNYTKFCYQVKFIGESIIMRHVVYHVVSARRIFCFNF